MKITMREAIKLAIQEEMRADASVIVFGEDVAEAGGVFKVTEGLLEEFGAERVRDTPISETAILGAGVGAAMLGFRPIVEMMFAEFFAVAMDQVSVQAAKMRYLSGGILHVPLVIRASAGGGLGFGAQHSQTLESWFLNTPGLTVVSPSSPRAAYGLLRSAVRCDDPVIFLEPRALYNVGEEFDPSTVSIDLGRAAIARDGNDIVLIGLGRSVTTAIAAAQRLEGTIDCGVIDLQTVLPWDRNTVISMVTRVGRALIVEENPETGGWGTEVANALFGNCFFSLKAPIARVTCPDAPVPFGTLESAYLPSVDDVVAAVRHVMSEETLPPARWSGWSAPNDFPSRTTDEQVDRRSVLADPLQRYERLVEIRLVENAVMELFLAGLVAGSTHTCQGQEAVAVGIAAEIQPSDAVTCTYRGHGAALALGATPLEVIAEILGRIGGSIRGKGGSMHLAAPAVGLLPTFAIVGAGAPIAAGAALAAQVRGDQRIAVAIFGDGATNIGAIHETMNLASVWKLPLLLVCENNLYGEYSRLDRTTSVADLAERAAAYRMRSAIVDGQDLDRVMVAVREAAGHARAGDGPTFLEMKTYRYAGHSRGDPAKYRPEGELDRWKERDPISIYATSLMEARRATEQELSAARARAEARVREAVDRAKAMPTPEWGEILRDVRAEGDVGSLSVPMSALAR